MTDVTRTEEVQAVVDGQMFAYGGMVLALAAGASDYSMFSTGSSPVMVEKRSVATSAKDIEFRLYENVSFTGGTILPGLNLNRAAEFIVAEPSIVRTGVTPGALPTPLLVLRVVETNTVSASFGDSSADKLRLAANTNYLLRLINNDNQPRDVSWSFMVRRSNR